MELQLQETIVCTQVHRQKKFGEIYESAFPSVAMFVRKMGGCKDDAQDIFHDAVVIYFEKKYKNELHIEASEIGYLVGIAKHLWLHKFKKDLKSISLDDFEKSISISEDFYPSSEALDLLKTIEQTGKKCLEILSAFYFEKVNLKRIATLFNFSSERSATVQKYKCIEKLRSYVKTKNLNYHDFTE